MKRGRPSPMTPRSEPDAPAQVAPDPEPWECGLLLLKPEYDMLLFLLETGRFRAARLMEMMTELKAQKDTLAAPEEKR